MKRSSAQSGELIGTCLKNTRDNCVRGLLDLNHLTEAMILSRVVSWSFAKVSVS